jgi:hypothetical protein
MVTVTRAKKGSNKDRDHRKSDGKDVPRAWYLPYHARTATIRLQHTPLRSRQDLAACRIRSFTFVRKVVEMSIRFGHIGIVWSLVLMTVWLGDRLYRSCVSVIDAPEPLTPEGTLSDWEKSNIELFQVVSASVAYLTTAQVRFNPHRSWYLTDRGGSPNGYHKSAKERTP